MFLCVKKEGEWSAGAYWDLRAFIFLVVVLGWISILFGVTESAVLTVAVHTVRADWPIGQQAPLRHETHAHSTVILGWSWSLADTWLVCGIDTSDWEHRWCWTPWVDWTWRTRPDSCAAWPGARWAWCRRTAWLAMPWWCIVNNVTERATRRCSGVELLEGKANCHPERKVHEREKEKELKWDVVCQRKLSNARQYSHLEQLNKLTNLLLVNLFSLPTSRRPGKPYLNKLTKIKWKLLLLEEKQESFCFLQTFSYLGDTL